MAVLGYLAKLKTGFGASFWCTYCAWFSIKMFIFNTLSMKKFQCRTLILPQDTKQNVIKFLIRQIREED